MSAVAETTSKPRPSTADSSGTPWAGALSLASWTVDAQLFVEGLDAYEDQAADRCCVKYGVGNELRCAQPHVIEAAGLAPFGQRGDDEVARGARRGSTTRGFAGELIADLVVALGGSLLAQVVVLLPGGVGEFCDRIERGPT
ncbi:hypothetical protein ACFW5D_01810 [Streptomyces sp. NPDC058770]|uniref:hypothetical protein n=1 Tax=unclassified Streptomyces TaxID=2593676 RepID=UPI0036A1B5E9